MRQEGGGIRRKDKFFFSFIFLLHFTLQHNIHNMKHSVYITAQLRAATTFGVFKKKVTRQYHIFCFCCGNRSLLRSLWFYYCLQILSFKFQDGFYHLLYGWKDCDLPVLDPLILPQLGVWGGIPLLLLATGADPDVEHGLGKDDPTGLRKPLQK
jgi:hypothetical protein